MKRSCAVLLLAVTWVFSTAFSCRFGPTPSQGDHSLPVPFHMQENDYFCGPATIQMWAHFQTGSAEPQISIWNAMKGAFPNDVNDGLGASPASIAWGASAYTGIYITHDQYFGITEMRKAVADIEKGIDRGDPTISVVRNGLHAVIVVGTTWHELETAQPQNDLMIVHDPLRSPRMYSPLGAWLGNDGISCDSNCMLNIQRATQFSHATQELMEFDYWGGTYYGDPNPPPCTTDACVGQLRPDTPSSWPGRLMGALAMLTRQGRPAAAMHPNLSVRAAAHRIAADRVAPNHVGPNYAALNHAATKRVTTNHSESPEKTPLGGTVDRASRQPAGVRAETYVPKPWSSSRDDVIENFYAGVSQTRVDRMPGMAGLTDPDSGWVVRDVIRVRSLGSYPNYHLLHIVDRAGQIVAAATVNEQGWLMGVEDTAGLDLPRPIALQAAEDAVARRRPTGNVTAREYVYSPSTLERAASPFAPLVAIAKPEGAYYVNSGGAVFAERAAEPAISARGGDGSGRRTSRHVMFVGKEMRAFARID